MKHIEQVRAVVVRKGQGTLGQRIGDHVAYGGPLAYLLDLQSIPDEKLRTVHLDLGRSSDFYRIPIGEPVLIRIGRRHNRIGWWVDTWCSDTP